jgi:hypothetical protein
MTTIIAATETFDVPNAIAEDDALWMDADDLARVSGYELKPEGFCRDTVCIPVPADRADEFVRGTEPVLTNLAAFWSHLGGPVVRDEAATHWSLGEPPASGALPFGTVDAPDFTLPDATGRLHSLSDYRGQKVLLATWASW